MAVAVSPIEPEHSPAIPIELQIPLPESSNCSEYGEDHLKPEETLDNLESWDAGIGPCSAILPIPTNREADEDTPMLVTETPSVSLGKLAKLCELEQHTTRHALSMKDGLDKLSLSSALARRLIRSSSLAYREMVDQLMNNDHGDFAASYQACEDLVDQCMRGEGSQPFRDSQSGGVVLNPNTLEDSTQSWIHMLPADYQEDILELILKIRTDPNFLYGCISRLSSSELIALTSSHQFSGTVESIFQGYFRDQTRTNGKNGRGGSPTTRVEALRNFYQDDPFFSLLYGVFDDSCKQGSSEYHLRADMWSTACARILTEGKQGSEEFVITILDTFSSFQDWKLKPKMELFLMKLLNIGSFLLDPPQPTDFKKPVELRNAQAVIAVSNFFDDSLKELFQLLADEQPFAGVPSSALDFARAILTKIQDPRVQLRSKTFITTRWYFSSYISNFILYPESQGVLTNYHIGDTVRQKILKELTNRMQKQVADVTAPWNHLSIVSPDIQARVGQFLEIFEPCPLKGSSSPMQHDGELLLPAHLLVSPQTLICLINFFYPELPSPSIDSPYSANPSTSSSLAGCSTLASGSTDLGSTAASSLTPSISGTLVATSSLTNENPQEDLQTKDMQCPLTQLGALGLKTQTIESKYNLGHKMRSVCKKLAELLPSDKDQSCRWSAQEWVFIYIARDRKSLSWSPPSLESSSYEGVPSIDEVHPLPRISRQDLEGLRQAITMIFSDSNSFHELLWDAQAQVGESYDVGYVLKQLFERAMLECEAKYCFTEALLWWKNIQLLQKLSIEQHHPEYLNDHLRAIERDIHTDISSHTETMKRNQTWYYSLKNLQNSQQKELNKLEIARKALRIKMWYVSDVRHSAPYEDALYVARALRAMANSSRTKQPGSITNWARHRLRSSLGQDRSEAQTLEILAAHKDYGGLAKLADDQVELTSRWLTRNSVENFCKGEERIHRFCFEVQRCVNKLAGLSLLDSPVLWSSRLFGREKLAFDGRLPASRTYEGPYSISNTQVYASNQNSSNSSQMSYLSINSSVNSDGFIQDHRTNHLSRIWSLPKSHVEYNATSPASKSRLTYHPGVAPPHSSSTTQQFTSTPGYSGLARNIPNEVMDAKKAFTDQIKKVLYSFLISDLGYLLWTQGSETDTWINLRNQDEFLRPPQSWQPRCMTPDVGAGTKVDPRNGDSNQVNDVVDQTERALQDQHQSRSLLAYQGYTQRLEEAATNSDAPAHSALQTGGTKGQSLSSPFPYSEAYKLLLERFSFSPDPYFKLQMLSELEALVSISLAETTPSPQIMPNFPSASPDLYTETGNYANRRDTNVPRTKATSLEEVIANCTERRAGTLKFTLSKASQGRRILSSKKYNLYLPDPDSITNALLAILRDPTLRPRTLYRDLQFIAAFVPSSVLDQTSQGKTFWDASLAALVLKEDLCASMITRATAITTYHISVSKTLSNPQDDVLANTTLGDAARLWLITAKEGSPLAARELGLFYLTHPELLPRVTLPLSKAKDVFRLTASGDHRGGSAGVGGLVGGAGIGAGATGGLDAWTFAVVFHWMELAANGGDRDARDFLKGNGELSAGR